MEKNHFSILRHIIESDLPVVNNNYQRAFIKWMKQAEDIYNAWDDKLTFEENIKRPEQVLN